MFSQQLRLMTITAENSTRKCWSTNDYSKWYWSRRRHSFGVFIGGGGGGGGAPTDTIRRQRRGKNVGGCGATGAAWDSAFATNADTVHSIKEMLPTHRITTTCDGHIVLRRHAERRHPSASLILVGVDRVTADTCLSRPSIVISCAVQQSVHV